MNENNKTAMNGDLEGDDPHLFLPFSAQDPL